MKSIAIVVVFAISLMAAPSFADSSGDQGIKLYNAGDYRSAAKYFAHSLQTNKSSLVLYYAGCCFLKLNEISGAKDSFRLLVEAYPQSQEAALARKALQSLDSSAQENNTPSIARMEKSAIPEINDPLGSQLISVLRHTENTNYIIQAVKSGLSKVSQHVKQALLSGEYQVLIVPMTLDVMDSGGDKPRGYHNGGGYDNVRGVFLPNRKCVVVAERASWQCNPPTLNTIASATVRHEIGHAYDQYMGKLILHSGNISAAPIFRQASNSDAQNLSNTKHKEFEYFVQPNGAGEQELFAELFYAQCLSDTESSGRAKRAYDLVQSFPKTVSLVRDLIAQRNLERFTNSDD